jgi:hypothetical protein
MASIHQSLEDLGGGKPTERVDLPPMMKKNSESNFNESKSEYGQQKALGDGYAALNGQLKQPIGPSHVI